MNSLDKASAARLNGAAVLPRLVLSEQVKEIIIKAIMSGDLEPGQRVVESALAKQLGVSQAPVREAIRDLVLLGFLEAEPYKGTSVRSFTTAGLYEVYTVRAALESLAARLAASRLTEDELTALRKILADMIEAGKNRETDRMVGLDIEFHSTIVRMSGNKLLYQLLQTLRFGYWTIVTTRISSYNLEELAARHAELLEALETRDPERAAHAMQHHIEDLGKPAGV
ncbi:MAG: GntR family transcriptional regulator [Thermoflexales bacterium]|nr:GntR family transcriptional regulator [Thermoflexales bacterium]